MFSRNASSSRAIPVAKMIEDLRRDPAMPVFWGSNKPGMQAGEELDEETLDECKDAWFEARDWMIQSAEWLMARGLHKQIANRILEPWAHINVVCTATDWENFYALRRHKDAQPEIKALADAMWDAQQASTPRLLQPGQWHLPYITKEDWREAYHGPSQTPEWNMLKRVSVARCARVSYLTHDGKTTTVEEDLQLYDRLLGSSPLHASPAEHQATPDEGIQHGFNTMWMKPELHGNLRGWIQFRKTLRNEWVPG